MVCTVFNPTLKIARQEVQEVATDDVVFEKVEDVFAHFSIKYSNFFNILLFHYILLQSKTLFISILSKFFCIPLAKISTYYLTWVNNIIYCGSRIFVDIVCHSQQC